MLGPGLSVVNGGGGGGNDDEDCDKDDDYHRGLKRWFDFDHDYVPGTTLHVGNVGAWKCNNTWAVQARRTSRIWAGRCYFGLPLHLSYPSTGRTY